MIRAQLDSNLALEYTCNYLSLKTNKKAEAKNLRIFLPDGTDIKGAKVLLHACCAPCSSAIIECMLKYGMIPTVYFCNPNIAPLQEYEIRKQELIRFLKSQNVPFVEAEYNHETWLNAVKGLENEPERGNRCSLCFELRLMSAAKYASENGFKWLTTTLASSRWKNIEQINAAGNRATQDFPFVIFWEQNWRRGGLQERRNELLHLYEFYNQTYCGCEYSNYTKKEKGEQ